MIEVNSNASFIDSVIGRAIVAGVELQDGSASNKNSLAELNELAKATNVEVVYTITQKLSKIQVGTYFGKGKLDEIKERATAHNADILLVDDELSGMQIRNLEAYLDMEIIDRTSLILEIFGTRAKTKEGKLQVELARLNYAKPRDIGGIGIMLSRQGGGIGTRGLGEKKHEIDKRNISKKIREVENQIKDLKQQREIRRKSRKKSKLPTVALVGYTNAGKSTLMNHFIRVNNPLYSKHESPAKDMLFATLDPFHRRIALRDNLDFILVDTVGFVSRLPHSLVDAFMSTLEEVKHADLLLYIVDASDDKSDLQLSVTQEVVKELEAEGTPYIVIENKADQISSEKDLLDPLATTARISALTGEGIEELLDVIEEKLLKDFQRVELLIPFDEGKISNYLLSNTKVENHEYRGDGVYIDTYLTLEDYNRYGKYKI